MRARVIRTDGTTESIDLPAGEAELDAIYAAIGCECVDVIELVKIDSGRAGLSMYVDDEGLWKDSLVRNEVAVRLVGELWNADPEGIMVVGDVLVTGGHDSEGGTLTLTKGQDDVLVGLCSRYASQAALA